jgi:hypothetical protein
MRFTSGSSRRAVVATIALVITTVLVTSSASAKVLLVGTYHGIAGKYQSIQDAVDHAKSGDWILVGPGDYHERADYRAKPGPQPSDDPAGVVITTPNLHVRGMDRNQVIVDGTRPGSQPCSSSKSDQDFGAPGPSGTPLGRNGILVWKANNTWIENMTVCNFLGGSGSAGNEVWWNGGDGGGHIDLSGFWGNYLNATSTYYDGESTAAAYGIFSSDSTNGQWTQTYASNMNDSNYYVGACQQQCDTTLDHVWSQYSSLGYSGTNSGGTVVVKNSEFDHNQDGFDTNSQNNDDWPSPQDGSCPNGATSPDTGTHSCWVFMDNYVHDNNNPNVPGAGVAAAGPAGTGMTISGGRNDTVMNNRFENNGAWGILFVPYPDSETPPPDAPNCRGGIASNPTNFCLYDDWGNALLNNSFKGNGSFGNPTNGDFGEITETAAPTNCFHGNTDPAGVTSSPANLQQKKPVCNGQTVPPDPNPQLTNQVACDSQFFAALLPTGSEPCTPGSNYPRRTHVDMPALPTGQLPTMPDPCTDVPKNPWCT